jgi:hypothetical protein
LQKAGNEEKNMDDIVRDPVLANLDVFIGEWSMEALFSDASATGRAVFEWMLGGQFLVQRSEIAHPDAPNSVAIVSLGSDRDSYFQHYFDSRGVARSYAMSFSEGIWSLLRETPDFSPLDFSQRFTGAFIDGGNTIEGEWETSRNGTTSWEHDFYLTYRRVK